MAAKKRGGSKPGAGMGGKKRLPSQKGKRAGSEEAREDTATRKTMQDATRREAPSGRATGDE